MRSQTVRHLWMYFWFHGAVTLNYQYYTPLNLEDLIYTDIPACTDTQMKKIENWNGKVLYGRHPQRHTTTHIDPKASNEFLEVGNPLTETEGFVTASQDQSSYSEITEHGSLKTQLLQMTKTSNLIWNYTLQELALLLLERIMLIGKTKLQKIIHKSVTQTQLSNIRFCREIHHTKSTMSALYWLNIHYNRPELW